MLFTRSKLLTARRSQYSPAAPRSPRSCASTNFPRRTWSGSKGIGRSVKTLKQLVGVRLQPARRLDSQRTLERHACRGRLAQRHLRLAQPAPRPRVVRREVRVDAQVLGGLDRVAAV